MRIVILDYTRGCCDVITGFPKEKTQTEEVENFLSRMNYRVADCYWMAIDDENEDFEGSGTIYEYSDGLDGKGEVNTLDPVNF